MVPVQSRDPFAGRLSRKFCPEILVEWIAPQISIHDRHKRVTFFQIKDLWAFHISGIKQMSADNTSLVHY